MLSELIPRERFIQKCGKAIGPRPQSQHRGDTCTTKVHLRAQATWPSSLLGYLPGHCWKLSGSAGPNVSSCWRDPIVLSNWQSHCQQQPYWDLSGLGGKSSTRLPPLLLLLTPAGHPEALCCVQTALRGHQLGPAE